MACKYIRTDDLLTSIRHNLADVCEGKGDFSKIWKLGFSRKKLSKIISNLPAAEVKPVHFGRWLFEKDGSARCSECHCWQDHIWDLDDWQNYCGHCGADMREYVEIDGKITKNPKLKER